QRLRAVLMTTFVAMFGLLPAALSNRLGAQTQKPLAVVVIGGALALAGLSRALQPALLVAAHGLHPRPGGGGDGPGRRGQPGAAGSGSGRWCSPPAGSGPRTRRRRHRPRPGVGRSAPAGRTSRSRTRGA